MFRREKSAKNLFLPYKQFGIDIFKKVNNIQNNNGNNVFNPLFRTPMSFYRPLSKTKSESLFEVEKKLKKMALSNKDFFNYMNKYTKLTQNFTFKTPNISIYPKKKNPKYLPIFYLEKIGYKNIEQEIKDEDKSQSNNGNNFDNLNDYNNFDQVNLYNNEKYNNEENEINEDEDNIIKEKPYGFKFKDTRIVYDKSKMRVKSSLFRNNNSEFNLTNIPQNQNFKNKTNFNFHISKEEKRRNKVFKYFYEGDFLDTYNQRPQSRTPFMKEKMKLKRNIEINDYDVNNNIQILYDMIKNIRNINTNNYSTSKSMKYNIRNYYKKEDFSFQVDIESLCLKYINQDLNLNEIENNNNFSKSSLSHSQKLYLPFSYLPIFYLLDYTSFKIFLSEIIYYNKENNMMEINQNDVLKVINKYKKFITLNVINNQDPNKKKKMEKITYQCKEHHFPNEYDWIIYLNEEEENNNNGEEFCEKNEESEKNEQNEFEEQSIYKKNIIYKVKIIMPIIKFQILNKRIKIKKYLNKNLLIKLLKNDFAKWEENVLCELFLNKQFRNIMNSSLASNKHIFNFSLLTKKIFIDRTENKENLLTKSKYEFFITNAQKEFSHFLYYSPYSILVLFGKEKDKKIFTNIHLNLKESINLKKYSKYWGYMNTLNKCLKIDINKSKIHFDLNILEKDPKKFFYLKSNEENKISKNENIKDFEKLGFIKFKNNEDIEMSLLNCSIVEMQITTIKLEKRYYKVPKNLLDIFLSENMKNFQNLNLHISENCELILFNEQILNLRREEIDLRRKAFHNDGTIKFDEDFSSEKHKTIFSFKNFNKLNSFRINPQNRYSNNPGMNKSIGRGINFFSGDSIIKRSETNDKISLGGLGLSYKNNDPLYKTQKIKRSHQKKYTMYHRKRESNLSKSNVRDYNERNPHKNNTNIRKVDENKNDNNNNNYDNNNNNDENKDNHSKEQININ